MSPGKFMRRNLLFYERGKMKKVIMLLMLVMVTISVASSYKITAKVNKFWTYHDHTGMHIYLTKSNGQKIEVSTPMGMKDTPYKSMVARLTMAQEKQCWVDFFISSTATGVNAKPVVTCIMLW